MRADGGTASAERSEERRTKNEERGANREFAFRVPHLERGKVVHRLAAAVRVAVRGAGLALARRALEAVGLALALARLAVADAAVRALHHVVRRVDRGRLVRPGDAHLARHQRAVAAQVPVETLALPVRVVAVAVPRAQVRARLRERGARRGGEHPERDRPRAAPAGGRESRTGRRPGVHHRGDVVIGGHVSSYHHRARRQSQKSQRLCLRTSHFAHRTEESVDVSRKTATI